MKNPLSAEAFLDWVEKQPKYKRYDYGDPYNCTAAQYGEFLGMDPFDVGQKLAGTGFSGGIPIIVEAVSEDPDTFGALAKRLRNDLNG